MLAWLKWLFRVAVYFVIAIIAFPFLWTAYNIVRWPPDTHRYRVTLHVKYNGELKTGSAVLESRQTRASGLRLLLSSGTSNFRVRGVAPVVNLGDGGWMFVPVNRFRNLPWRVYDEDDDRDWGTVSYLPRKTPKRRIEFRTNPELRIGKYEGTVWVPPGFNGQNRSKFVEAETIAEESGLDIEFVGFEIEETDDPVLTGFQLPAEWPSLTDTIDGGQLLCKFGKCDLERETFGY